jgi:hypothetical protein
MNKEFKRMQHLAGLLTEVNIQPKHKTYHDSLKALGILFHPNEDPDTLEDLEYEWDLKNMIEFCRKIGYDDAEEVAGEATHYTSPGDEDEMDIFRRMTNNPDLQVSDLTLGMYRKSIEDEFEK